jgi:murein tripeptide amidase MpaA
VHGTEYVNQAFCGSSDYASGSSDDNGYFAGAVKYSFTVELRDTGRYGFVLPASQIIPTSEEIVNGMVAMWKYVAAHP